MGDEHRYAIDGGVSLAEVNDTLETDFESEAFDTIGGLVLSRLGRAPDVGDTIEVDGYEVAVEDVEGTRISSVLASRPVPETEDQSD